MKATIIHYLGALVALFGVGIIAVGVFLEPIGSKIHLGPIATTVLVSAVIFAIGWGSIWVGGRMMDYKTESVVRKQRSSQ